jgi:hypothetical protein
MSKLKRYSPSILNWSLWSGLYLCFLWWHGAFAPPLSAEEIDRYANKLHALRPDRTIEAYKAQLANDNGHPIFMVNIIKYFDEPIKAEGQVDEMKAVDLVKAYNHFVGKFLIQRGSYPIFLGDALGGTAAAWGVDDESEWSEAVVVRYRNLRTMMELATSQKFNENLAFKHAALEKTIIYPTEKRLMPGNLEYLVFFILLSGGLAAQLVLNSKFKSYTQLNLKRT